MPKMKTGKNGKDVTRIGKPVDLEAWLVEMESGKDGKEVRKNLTDTVYADISQGERSKDKDGRVTSIVSKMFSLNIEVAKRKIPANKDGKPYEMEYANLLPLTIDGAALLVNGNVDLTYEKDKDGKEEELPSVTKYFRQGFGMLARNNASSKIGTEVEGPDKALNATIAKLMKIRGWSKEKATERAKLMFAE